MHDKYPDILDGSKKTMSLFPEKFDYDSRVKLHNPVLVELLEEMKRTQKDFKDIENFIRLIKPQAAEELVFSGLSKFFYNQRGMFLHSLKLDQYLKIFVDLSMQGRKSKPADRPLTAFEERMKEAFRISEESLNKPGDEVIGALQKSQASEVDAPSSTIVPDPTKTFLGSDIIKALIDTKQKGFGQRKFNDDDRYTEEQIRSILRVSKFEMDIKFPGENDFLTVLADLKLFVCLEVKCQVDTKGKEAKVSQNSQLQSLPNLDGNLQSAAKQLKKVAYQFAKLHAPILSRGWKFLKVAGVFPHVINTQKLCGHCRKWIITEDIIKTPGGLQKWWEKTGILEQLGKIDEKMKREGYEEYLILFNRYINLSRIGLQKVTLPSTWEHIQGSNAPYISAGYTSAPAGSSSNDLLGFKNAKTRPTDAFKVLCFEPDQQEILTTVIPRIVFLCDFGSG